MCTIVLCMGALEYDNKQSSVENTFTFQRNVSSPPPVVIIVYKFDVLLPTDADVPDLLL